MAQPVILLVEDDPDTLLSRRRVFEAADCAVIPVTNSDDAMRQIFSAPLVSLVITDINLNPDDEDDKSGLSLMRYLKGVRQDLPIAGYSAHFAEKTIPKDDRDAFDYWYPKAQLGTKAIRDNVVILKNRAIQYQDARRTRAESQLAEMREAHGIDPIAFEHYRSLLPGDSTAIEQALAASGYEALIVYPVPPRETTPSTQSIAVPLIFWFREVDHGTEVELLGVPEIYGFGEDSQTAIAQTIELMQLFHSDFSEGSMETDLVASQLKDFLSRIFID